MPLVSFFLSCPLSSLFLTPLQVHGMEIVKTIFPHGNSTHDEEKPLPECLEWVRGAPSSLTVILLPLEMDPLYFSFLMLSCGFCLVVIVLAGLQLYYVIKYVSNERIRTDLYYLVLMFPVRFESQMERGSISSDYHLMWRRRYVHPPGGHLPLCRRFSVSCVNCGCLERSFQLLYVLSLRDCHSSL